MAFFAFFKSAELPNTCLNPHYFCNRNILAKTCSDQHCRASIKF